MGASGMRRQIMFNRLAALIVWAARLQRPPAASDLIYIMEKWWDEATGQSHETHGMYTWFALFFVCLLVAVVWGFSVGHDLTCHFPDTLSCRYCAKCCEFFYFLFYFFYKAVHVAHYTVILLHALPVAVAPQFPSPIPGPGGGWAREALSPSVQGTIRGSLSHRAACLTVWAAAAGLGFGKFHQAAREMEEYLFSIPIDVGSASEK